MIGFEYQIPDFGLNLVAKFLLRYCDGKVNNKSPVKKENNIRYYWIVI